MAATSSGVIAIILLIYCYIQQIDGFYRLKDTLGCFKLYSARYLEKSGTKYLNGYDDVTQCLSECLNSNENHKFICKSIMWKLDSKDCILSKYNTSDKTRNFKQAPGMQIDLYENQCLKRPNLNDEFEILFNMDLERTTTEQPSRNLTSSWVLNNASQQVEAIIDNINNQQITTILNNQPTTQNIQSINNQPPINLNIQQPPIQNTPPPIEAPPLKMRLFKPWDKAVQRNRTKHPYQHGTRQFAIDGEGRRHREFRGSTHDDVDDYDDLDSAVVSEDVVGEFDEDSEKELVVRDELPPAKNSQSQNSGNLNPIPVRATPPQVMPISLPLPNRSPLIQNIQNLQNGPPRNQLLQHSMNQVNQFQQQNQQLTAQSGQSVSVLRMQMQSNHQFGFPPQRNVIFYPTATLQQGGLNPHVNRQLGQIPPATFQGMIYQAPHNQQSFGRYETQRGSLLNPLTTTESPFIFVPGRGYVPRFGQQPPQTVFSPQSPLQSHPSMQNQHSQPQVVYHQQPNFTPSRPQNGSPLNFQQNQQNGPSQSAPQNSQAPRWSHPQQQHHQQQQTMMNNFQPQTQPIAQNSLNQFQPKPNLQTPNQFFQNQGPPQAKIAQPQPQTVTPTLITSQPKPSASQVDQIQFFRGTKKDVDPNPSQLQPLIPIQEPNPSQIRRKAVHGVGTYEPRADEIIYDNFFPRDYEPTERKTKCFRRYSSKALAHFEEKTIIGGSLKDCLLACQNMLEFLCASVNYYDLKKICILNGGNTELNAVKLMDSHRYNYFENVCASRGISTALAAPLQKISNFEVNKCFIEKRRNLLLTLDGTIIRNANTIETSFSRRKRTGRTQEMAV
ncbi:hypothetical protein WR25_09015 [Diploscapter pachys]|uniref:Apple domain-containing protein n=1 Tax=Diploscapter pachys TaxID=2018661 RepID=A0A2A2M1Y0_9BILA|nr:hypothetical protein WR25_09015 [Diploscapter pachys]